MSNNHTKVDKSHSDDCDSGSTDSLTSDSKANDKFTVFENLSKIKLKSMNRITKVKLVEFGQPKLAEVRPVESLITK